MESFPISRCMEFGLAAALAAASLLFAPGRADAALTQEVVGSRLVVKGDGEQDIVRLAVIDGKIAVNEEPTTLPANTDAVIQVGGGGGADVLDASDLPTGAYRALAILGEPGDDEILGGEESDEFFWNDGDGNDVVRGGGGRIDRLVVFGSETEGDDIRLVPGPTTKVERTNLDPFVISLPDGQGEVEEVAIVPLGGDDTFVASPGLPDLLIQAGGGPGDDTLVGGDNADQLFGGEGDDAIAGRNDGDVLFGEAGNDEIAGGGGNDLVSGNEGNDRVSQNEGGGFAFGGPGDDVVVWSAGDGRVVPLGEEGVDQLEVHGTDQADSFTASTAGQITTVEGTGPDSVLAFGTADEFEELFFVGGAGNDELTIFPGLEVLAAASGGDGNDTLAGAEEFDLLLGDRGADTLRGGAGGDLLIGGGGADELDGEEGDDSLRARDLDRDLVRGGAGVDNAVTDALDIDTVTEVELLDAGEAPPPPNPPPPPPLPPAPDTVALLPRLSRTTVLRRGHKLFAQTHLTCPAEEAGGCNVTLTLEATARRGGRSRTVLLGAKNVELKPGERRRVSIPFVAGAGLAVRGRLPARFRVESSDAAGNDAARTAAVVLRIPRP